MINEFNSLMKKILFSVILLLISCSPESSDYQQNEALTTTANDKIMKSNVILVESVWKGFNDLYLRIQQEVNENKLEIYVEKTFDWKSASLSNKLTQKENTIVQGLYSILRDEIKRTQERLSINIGRQPAVNWIESLSSHLRRLSLELDILPLILSHQRELDSSVILLSKSLRLSIELVEVDINQIEKRVEAGEILLAEDLRTLLDNAREKKEQAKRILNN